MAARFSTPGEDRRARVEIVVFDEASLRRVLTIYAVRPIAARVILGAHITLTGALTLSIDNLEIDGAGYRLHGGQVVTISGDRITMERVTLRDDTRIIITGDDVTLRRVDVDSEDTTSSPFTIRGDQASIIACRTLTRCLAAFVSQEFGDDTIVERCRVQGVALYYDSSSTSSQGAVVQNCHFTESNGGEPDLPAIYFGSEFGRALGNHVDSITVGPTGGSCIIFGNRVIGDIDTSSSTFGNVVAGNAVGGTVTTETTDAEGLNT